MQKPEKVTETWAHESIRQELSNEYQHESNDGFQKTLRPRLSFGQK